MFKERDKEIRDVADDLADLKLQISREHASITHLREVETRLTTAIGKLESQIDSLPERIARALDRAGNSARN